MRPAGAPSRCRSKVALAALLSDPEPFHSAEWSSATDTCPPELAACAVGLTASPVREAAGRKVADDWFLGLCGVGGP